jgi:sortase A
MRRLLRWLGTLLILGGLGLLAWSVAVWRWEDPFTSLYTSYEQRQLTENLHDRFVTFGEPTVDPAADARRYRRSTKPGEAIGRLEVPRLGLDMVLVYGVGSDTLKRGPGLHPRTFFPGQDRLVYIAGHRTTYGAPFSEIDSMRKGDVVRIEMPYGTFTYTVTRHRIVAATNVSVLRTRRYEQVALQACHPRFFASHRWITYGRLTKVDPPPAGSSASEP